MTEGARRQIDFKELRHAAIGFAQDASGHIWTDYNLHDPGVTFLEQTCFALSELSYLADHDIRDLLTNLHGHFNFRDLAIFKPQQVLGTTPVTRGDIEAWLADCRGVAWAAVSPTDQKIPGLYNVTIAPTDPDIDSEQLCNAIKAAFDRIRPLCCDLGALRVAVTRKVVLKGSVEITPLALPETVAAELYHAVSSNLCGKPRSAEGGRTGATRIDAYDAPEALFGANDSGQPHSFDLNARLDELRDLQGIRSIGELSLDSVESQEVTNAEAPFCLASVLPQTTEQVELKLTLDGAPVPLSAVRIRQEFLRISAERIAHAHHHTHREDWSVMRPGRHRDFDIADVDSLLPTLYRIHDQASAATHASMGRYRSAISAFLMDMAKDLGTLPTTFCAETDAATRDPERHRLRVALLDYLIALQGEEMPVTRHTGMHLYRNTRMQHDFEISWRTRYLMALPRINSGKATGPSHSGPGGFMTKLGILVDLDVQEAAALVDPMASYGLHLAADTEPSAPTGDPSVVILPADPFDMLVAEDETAEPLSASELLRLSPWIVNGAICPKDFERLADPDSLFMAPIRDGTWQILFDRKDGRPPIQLTVIREKVAAKTCVNRLRATWRSLHRLCEGAILIEDILLREDGLGFAGNTADLLFTGWTARCKLESYRNYVEQMVEQLSPAHILIHTHWLSLPDMTRVAAHWDDVKRGRPHAKAALRACLAELKAVR